MYITNILMRAAMPQERKYLPYGFEGKWTDEERALIATAIGPHVPERVAPMFNNWRFTKASPNHFMGRRATWDMGIFSCYTAQELADKVTAYYS
jgi:hypothetical protein